MLLFGTTILKLGGAALNIMPKRGISVTTPGDSSPGGATDIWCWETGIAMQWETGIFIQTN
jgi:hypothetical protein